MIRVPKVLLVSPIYSFPQLQGTLYTTPALRKGGSTSFTLVSCCPPVEIVVNVGLMSNLRILLRASFIPYTYGRQILYFGSSSSCSLFLCFCANLIMCTGYPLAFKTSVTCFPSFLTFSPIVTVMAQLNRQEATPLLTCLGW